MSSLQIDLTAPLNHSSIMSVLTQIKSLPTYYAIYLLVSLDDASHVGRARVQHFSRHGGHPGGD